MNQKKNGQFDLSLKLYDIAGQYEKVLDILYKQLGRVLTVPSSEREKLLQLIGNLYKKYESQQNLNDLCAQILDLVHLASFFELYGAKQYSKALDTIKILGYLPFISNEVESKVNSFRFLNDACIKRNFSEILLATMTCLYQIYISYRQSLSTGMSQGEIMNNKNRIIEAARSLIMFSGNLIQFRMPGDVYSRLLAMEAEMT